MTTAHSFTLAANAQPFDDFVVLHRDTLPETSAGGILIPRASDAPPTGRVLSAGPLAGELKPGDRVQFDLQAGCAYREKGLDLLVIRSSAIAAHLLD